VTPPKIVIHTDVLLDFLLHTGSDESTLRKATGKFFCYTTVFNAIELFSVARTDEERKAVEYAMSAMKILGLNAKNAKKYGGLLACDVRLPRMNTLVAGICLESRLPVLTSRPDEFRGVKELTVVPASKLMLKKSGADILRECVAPSKRNQHTR
jgi:predicted nucleic acid-binding protein